jgi:hypothetical protein
MRIPARQGAVALRNQLRVLTCMFRHVRLARRDPLHDQLSRAGMEGRLVKTPSRGTRTSTNGEDRRLQPHGINTWNRPEGGTSVSF